MVKRRAFFLLVFLCAAASSIAGANFFFLQRLFNQVEQRDPRNAGIVVAVHYRHYVDVGTVVFDLQEVPAGTTPEEMTRVLLQFAHRLGGQSFAEVRLAYRGREKFMVRGNDFRNAGPRFGTDKLHRLDGTRAFRGTPDDFTAWHRAWYRDALTEQIRATMEQAA
ncbi:MAG: hypothetical protein M3Y65_17730 [Pseudomonadota bacterium]|nr:hypothetical protein [Pseudomonadota bacterium]